MKIGIIGGTDGLGKTIAFHLKKEFEVYISGTNHTKGTSVANEFEINYVESNETIASLSDILIISVPIHKTDEVIKEVANSMKPGSVMVDVTSVKEEPLESMINYLPEDIEFIPTHPIFGPRTLELDNQVIVLTATKKGKWYPKVYNYLKDKNMRVLETTAAKHDYMMSIVQVLTHFSYISTASAIEKLKINIKDTEDYESPIYNLLIDMIARIASQNPYLTYYIQTKNKNGEKVRKAFSDAVIELQEITDSRDEKGFVELVNNATKHLGDIQAALGRSDKAINSLSEEFTKLWNSRGKEVGLKHIYSGKIHVGILENVSHDTVILSRNNKTSKLKLSNISILSDEELYSWKIHHEEPKSQTVSCVFPENVDKEIIKDTIYKLDNIIDVNVIEVYNGPQIDEGYVSITFEILGLYKDSVNNVIKLFEGFGGKIR